MAVSEFCMLAAKIGILTRCTYNNLFKRRNNQGYRMASELRQPTQKTNRASCAKTTTADRHGGQPYNTPRLVRFGSLSKLTRAGGAVDGDGFGTFIS